MQYKKFFVFLTPILMLFFSQFASAHETGFIHQHGEELAALSLVIVAVATAVFLKSRVADR